MLPLIATLPTVTSDSLVRLAVFSGCDELWYVVVFLAVATGHSFLSLSRSLSLSISGLFLVELQFGLVLL